MMYTVDVILRFKIEAKSKEDAEEIALFETSSDGYCIDVETMPSDDVIGCDECDATVAVRDHGWDEQLFHNAKCPKARTA